MLDGTSLLLNQSRLNLVPFWMYRSNFNFLKYKSKLTLISLKTSIHENTGPSANLFKRSVTNQHVGPAGHSLLLQLYQIDFVLHLVRDCKSLYPLKIYYPVVGIAVVMVAREVTQLQLGYLPLIQEL